MNRRIFAFTAALLFSFSALALAEEPSKPSAKAEAKAEGFPADSSTQGAIAVNGKKIEYTATAGTLLVAGSDAQDATLDVTKEPEKDGEPIARLSYVAYVKNGEKPENRPVVFLYNGGPGSATLWLHMGSFAPKRINIPDGVHAQPAPYALTDNAYTLIDVADLVFIDAPGTGFGRLYGKNAEKAFYGIDQDGAAFARFIVRFLSKYGRWNSPKYLLGESYGTLRSAVVSNILETDKNVDLNGVILLSQILSYNDSVDTPYLRNPGNDVPYVVGLPTFAATAWYHHKLPGEHKDLKSFLAEVERFALSDYAAALAQGSQLPDEQRKAILAKLHEYTGVSEEYLDKANLRVDVGKFNQTLQNDQRITTGRLDTRFVGPMIDPLSEYAWYDPQDASISSAYVSTFNDYVRRTLKFGDNMTYKTFAMNANGEWQERRGRVGSANVIPDLAEAMTFNPHLRILLTGGYYDLATPYFSALYEMYHLPIAPSLRKNIEHEFYESGHMVYVNEPALKQFHDRVATFIVGAPAK